MTVRRVARTGLSCSLLACLAGACASRAGPVAVTPAPPNLAASIDSIIDQPPLHRAHWGVHVIDAASGAVIYSRNAERHFITASNMKLVIGAVALARLGEEHRYRTEVFASTASSASDSVASLVVVATGDPTWSTRFYPGAAAPLDSIARQVAAHGIRTVGELVIDATRFRDELVHPTWEISDLVGSSAPPVDAFALAEGMFRVVLRGGAVVGAPGEAYVIGDVPQPLRASVRTDTAGARVSVTVDYTARRDTVYLRGSVGLNAADTVNLAVTRPADAAAHALANVLQRAGVRVGAVRVIRDSAQAAAARGAAGRIVATHTSPVMRDIVAGMLAPSQNWLAEQLLKTLGAELNNDGSWRGGIAIERAYLSDVVGIDTTAIYLRDASGLSAQNLLTPAATVALLAHAQRQPWGAAYRNGLAKPGSPGTLSNRLRPLDGRVFAKTGTITNVNSLSGYLGTDDGRDLIFSVFSNASGLPAATMRNAIDAIVLTLSGRAPR